ncbi:beta-xylosidase [Catalinimonas alkaloidigena]|nr:beta-xylosidase [Catalinimonas alkaloidigena]
MRQTALNLSLNVLVSIFLITSCTQPSQQSENAETDTVAVSGNPVFEGWYADPEGIIFDDQYWIFPTYSAPFEEQVFMDAFSSPDLVHWTRHEKIIDTSRVKWAQKAMWAPAVVENNGKYFLFFGANDIQTPERRGWKEGESLTYGA